MPVDRTCERCGSAFTTYPAHVRRGRGRFCSRSCGAQARWAGIELVGRYASMRFDRDHPLAPPSGGIQPHRAVLFAKIGPGVHSCHWCGTPVTWHVGGHTERGALVVDHIDNDGRNNDPVNLVPSCHRCNIRRTSPKTLADGEPFVVHAGQRQRAVEKTCEMCGRAFLAAIKYERRMPVRFCSMACRARYTLAGRGPEQASRIGRISTCKRWNIARGKPCTCGTHA